MLGFANEAQVLALSQIVHILLTLVENLILQPVALGFRPLFGWSLNSSFFWALLFGLGGYGTHVRKVG